MKNEKSDMEKKGKQIMRRVISGNTITLPKKICEKEDIREGNHVRISIEEVIRTAVSRQLEKQN